MLGPCWQKLFALNCLASDHSAICPATLSLRQSVDQRCATAMKGLEIDGLIVWRALLPAPREDADPCERQCPYGGLMGFALVALLLVVHLRPERMPDRLRRPFDARLPEELWTLEPPVHP